MTSSSFQTNPVELQSLLRQCEGGKIQLPDFQRSWVWGEDRIQSLIASVARSFPIGALMTLVSKPDGSGAFARRPVEGALPGAAQTIPEQLLLDGQQRMTSLYQACMRREVVATITPKKKLVRRWFYININRALETGADIEEAIFVVPEDKRVKANFDKEIVLDLSTPDYEYEKLRFPLNRVFDWDQWQDEFGDYWIKRKDYDKRDVVFRKFRNEVLQNFKSYHVPVISLGHETSHEAVCLVFEKVNTGGKALDAFELLTAMYSARGHRLREDWLGAAGKAGMQSRLAGFGRAADQRAGVLEKVASTDVLQAIALLHTKAVRAEKVANGVRESDLSAVRATRQSLLDLPLEAYLKYRDAIEAGFKAAAKFLRQQNIHRVTDLPYQTQIVPLAAIFAELGEKAEHAAVQAKIARWFWCGIFGELYSSAIESRFAKDIVEVPVWLGGGPEPSTVKEGVFHGERLPTMRTRLSAAYKGIHALLMKEGAKDFRTGQGFDITVFFDEAVDIHHIFPQDWCKGRKIDASRYDSVINKTPLSARTNRIIGKAAPSQYLSKLEQGERGKGKEYQDPPIDPADLDSYLVSHGIPVDRLRADDFDGFVRERRKTLLALIAKATGHPVSEEHDSADDGEELTEEMARDSNGSATAE